MNLNDYLLNNPSAVEGLFTKIFGEYMLRYYDQTGYRVHFSSHEPTSYQDANQKIIMISLENVISMLKKDIHVLAVAYHELAHVLYTDNDVRDKIRRKAIDQLHLRMQEKIDDDTKYRRVMQVIRSFGYIHKIWNVVEDTRIERLLVKDYPFLKEIVDPLKTMIDPGDDELFMWRSTQGKPSQEIVDLAEEFCSPKKKSQIKRAEILVDLFIALYFQELIDHVDQHDSDNYQENSQSDHDFSQEQTQKLDEYDGGNSSDSDIAKKRIAEERKKELKEDYKRRKAAQESMERSVKKAQDDLDQQIKDGTISDYDATREQDNIDHNARLMRDYHRDSKRIADDYQETYGEAIDDDTNEKASAQEKLQEIKHIESASAQDQAIKSMLESIQKTIVEQEENKAYDRAVQEYRYSPYEYMDYDTTKTIYNPKQKLRNGMSAAMSKRYSLDLSHKVSVDRIVRTKANKQAPQVFYNRGKDISFTKKIVIFEDVSSSTTRFSKYFSSMAYSLAQAFESVEWWGYGDYLFKKDPKDFPYNTMAVGRHYRIQIGGTNARNLLSVMRKYRNKDYTYVIITDGDMQSIFEEQATWNIFKDKVAVVGLLDNDIKKNAPHNVDLLEHMAKRKGYYPKPNEDIHGIIKRAKIDIEDLSDPSVVVHGINGVMELVKGRLA